MKAFFKFIGDLWCMFMHEDIYRPVNGKYICRVCQRIFPTPFG